MTIEELNDRVWYRALKVGYVLTYLLFFAIGSVLVIDNGRYHIPSRLPASTSEALRDENFYLLSSDHMISTLSAIDADFRGLPESEKQKVVSEIRKWKSQRSKGKANYVYIAQSGTNLHKTLSFAVIFILSTIAVMEFIRRCFYYVMIGKILPKVRQR